MMSKNLLSGIQVVNLSNNLPGPAAAARLQQFGAQVKKVEPPGGDPFVQICPDWYQDLCREQQIFQLDLKKETERVKLDEWLVESDLLITSIRLPALERLNLSWLSLHSRFPQLCHVAILGYPSPHEDRPGHDLTYQATLGLVIPPVLPRTLMADLAGAERAVSAALALLLTRSRGGEGGYMDVTLSEAAASFAAPLRYQLTTSGGMFGGGLAGYNLYETQRGWIAVAALEPHFWERLTEALNLDSELAEAGDLRRMFLIHPAEYWESWAEALDIPLVEVSGFER